MSVFMVKYSSEWNKQKKNDKLVKQVILSVTFKDDSTKNNFHFWDTTSSSTWRKHSGD